MTDEQLAVARRHMYYHTERFGYARPNVSSIPLMTEIQCFLLARVFSGRVELPPPAPEAPGPFRYADSARLFAILERAGFAELSASQWRGRLPVGGLVSPAEAAVFALASFGSFAELLAEAGGEAFDEARRSLADCFASQQQEGAVRLDACVHICTGVRAS